MNNLQETVRIVTVADQAALKDAAWSTDGQLFCVSTTQGGICVYITKLNLLYAASPPRIAILSSLAEVTIHTYEPDKTTTTQTTISLEIEPSFIAVGSYNFACGMNNHIWFYDLGRAVTDTAILLCDREYMADIKEVELNTGYCAVRCGTKVLLHPIESSLIDHPDKEPKLFPDEIAGVQDTIITTLALSNEFHIFGTDVSIIYSVTLQLII